MRLIDRYVGSRVLIGIGVTLFIFVAIDFVSQIVDETDHTRGAYTFLEVLRYSVFRVPGAAIENLSFAALIGSLIGLGGLANHNELTVLRAAGVSTFRIAWSAMRACIAVILVGMFVAEWVRPSA